jgi:hypothetical protein
MVFPREQPPMIATVTIVPPTQEVTMLWMAVATILIALVGIVLAVRADAKAEPDVADWDR